MANITGTNAKDTLTGTDENDIIQGLNGNDLIIGSLESDIIDGGTGKDVLDYSKDNRIESLFVQFNFAGTTEAVKIQRQFGEGGASSPSSIDRITNVEEFIGIGGKNSGLTFGSISADTIAEINLPNNRLTYFSQLTGRKTFTIKNFNTFNIFADAGRVRIVGSDFNDNIAIGSNTTDVANGSNNEIVGSKGDDTLSSYGSNVNTTLDYSSLDRGVKIMPNVSQTVFRFGFSQYSLNLSIGKDDFGTDTLVGNGLKKIVGATNKLNKIDGSIPNTNFSSLDINLAKNLLTINRINPTDDRSGGFLTQQFEVINFTDAIGTKNNDTIVGANKKGKLTGGGGSDTITGGNKNDTITGSDSTARGVGEVDTLTGGGGRDQFILGDNNGAYYVGNGNNDYATITDFNIFQDSISVGNLNNYSFALGSSGSIDLYSGKDVNTRDLVAKIQIAGGISSVSSNSRSIAGSSPNLDSIISKIDILSGSASNDA